MLQNYVLKKNPQAPLNSTALTSDIYRHGVSLEIQYI